MPSVSLRLTGDNKENIEYVSVQGPTGFRWGGTNGHPFNAVAALTAGSYKVTFEVPGYKNDENIQIDRNGTIVVEENQDDYSITFT